MVRRRPTSSSRLILTLWISNKVRFLFQLLYTLDRYSTMLTALFRIAVVVCCFILDWILLNCNRIILLICEGNQAAINVFFLYPLISALRLYGKKEKHLHRYATVTAK